MAEPSTHRVGHLRCMAPVPPVLVATWRSIHEANVIYDSRRLVTTAAGLRAEAQAVRRSARESVATARNHRQVGVLRRALQRRLAELSGERTAARPSLR